MLGSMECLYAQFRFSACKEPPYPWDNLLPFPIPVVGCPPGGSFPGMGKQGWPSLQPWLLLLTPIRLLPLAGALQSLSAAFPAHPTVILRAVCLIWARAAQLCATVQTWRGKPECQSQEVSGP